MKFMWFHLMPYTELPEDFRSKHSSVWVDIDPALFDPEKAHVMYNEFLDELEYAADCGFDAICVNEHHANAYGMMPSPNLIAAALARRTKDVAICVLGSSLALYNPPTRIAEEFGMIDVISGGRLIAGFPVGTPMDTCYAYSQNPSTLRDRYHEAHDLVIRAWTETKPFVFNGRYNQQYRVNAWQRPVQKPHPPIWIPAASSVETAQWCAEMDYVYCYLSYYGAKGEATKKQFDLYWDALDKLGKPPNPNRAGFLQFVAVGESRQHAMDLYGEAAEYFYARCLHTNPAFTSPPGYTSETTQRAGLVSQVQVAAADSRNVEEKKRDVARDIEGIVDNGYVILGSPDEVVERLRDVATSLNIGHLLLLLQFGNMSRDVTKYNTNMFAQHVIPKLRDLHSEWENPWWPRPLSAQRRAFPAAFSSDGAGGNPR